MLSLQPTGNVIQVTDQDPLSTIQQLIQEELKIPVEHQLLFMEDEFQKDDQQIFPNLKSNLAHIVDARGSIALLCIELPNKTRQPLLLDRPWMVSNLNKAIEQRFGYAILAQQLQLQNGAPTYNTGRRPKKI
ncbi:unnamed protein product, partial [Rotaria sp. Silwood2]